tara:strand:- start:70 stop:516 length:447 start_codon:yes stop_codon:yes gene_type:complete
MATPSQSSVMFYPGYSQAIVNENLVWKAILTITQAYPMVVTTTNDHHYVAGMRVRFNIPGMFGMVQLNGVEVQVLEVTNNTLTVNVDSSNFTPFVYPVTLPEAYTPPVVIPDASGKYLPPLALPDPNQTSFEGTVYNNGLLGNPINGN